MKNKSQITIFIIIGAIIIFSVITIFYFQAEQAEIPRVPVITEEIPSELQPIRSFVQDCIRDVGIDALERIGSHGGYIGVTASDTADYTRTSFSIDATGQKPTEYDALRMSDDWHIPYWFYLKSPNKCSGDCELSTKKPPLLKSQGSNSIEDQINRYISLNLPQCLDNFRSFEQRDIIITPLDDITTTTTIGKDDVTIFVEYPLKAEFSDGESSISQFSQTFDVPLMRMYRLASEINEAQSRGRFLEAYTLHLIAAYSGIDEDKLPPMAGSDLSFKPVTWRASEVSKKLQDILSVYINIMRATRTRNFDLADFYFPGDALRTGLYGFAVLPLQGTLPDDYFGFDVDFNYLGWPMYFHITSGELIKPRESISIPILSMMIPLQRYDLPYDVSFPVLVSIRDPGALRGRGYSFVFALESNIRNNQPVTGDTAEVKMSIDLSEDATYCEEKQLNSADVSFRVVDLMGQPVPDVSVTFAAGDTGCVIGFTELDEEGRAVFTGKFPKGAIGAIILEHPDYDRYVKPYFRGKEELQDLGQIKMNGFITKNVTAKRIDIDKLPLNDITGGSGWTLMPVRHSLRGFERAIIMLERIPETPYDSEVFAAAEITQTQQAEMRLVPGRYNMNIVILQEGRTIAIPKDKVEVDGEDETIPRIELVNNGDFMSGQYEIEITLDNGIYYDNIIEFTAVSFNIIGVPDNERKHSDLDVWSNVDRIANNNADLLMPVLVAGASG